MLLDDGLLELTVLAVDPAARAVVCVAHNAAPIKARKGVNLPGCAIQLVTPWPCRREPALL